MLSLRDGNKGGTSRGLKLPPNWLAILIERGKTLTLFSFVFFFATTPFLSQPPPFLSFSVSFLLFFFHSLSLSFPSGPGHHRRRARGLRRGHQGGAARDEGHVRRGAGVAGRDLPQRRVHPFKGNGFLLL